MNSIKRIDAASAANRPSSMRQGQDQRSGKTDVASKDMIISPAQPRANAGLRIEQPHYRPAANFLAQYIDQHFRWPRAPHRKDRQRQQATSAYITAEMLPDILADALRLHPVDKKL
tara:strand:+ start:153351 stop:153698 length:348 start_codon:yes stop_codon:yes gene_type:complete